MPKIRLENLVKVHGVNKILQGINLEMQEDEFTVLVGPSGCGKSTLLRMIAGLDEVTSGEIYMDEKPIKKLPPKARNLAMVFQDYALYPHMNVAKNMSFSLRLQRLPKAKIDKKIKEIASMLGLQDLLLRKPAELSGGQRQRVAMGRALTKEANTFLFDEPLSNLDAKLRGVMRAELALLHQKVKKNVIYVTHDQIEAMTLGDRIVVMNGGYVQQQGSPEELFKCPANKFVAGFMGSPAMNFLNAEAVEENGVMKLNGHGFSITLNDELRAKVKAQSQQNLIIGIRPCDFIPITKVNTSNTCLHLKIILLEYIGAQSILLTQCGENNINVELKSDNTFSIGEYVNFEIPLQKIHLFDSNTEMVI